jgi:phosphotransferase system  glucose/maltose/N-acetylglucosamine-specific IIC component
MIGYIALGVAITALIGVIYIMFVALPKVGDGVEQLGDGLATLGKRVQDFAAFMAGKL